MFKRILEFCKKEIVLMIALLLAAVSGSVCIIKAGGKKRVSRKTN